jgi:hypothetical protein
MRTWLIAAGVFPAVAAGAFFIPPVRAMGVFRYFVGVEVALAGFYGAVPRADALIATAAMVYVWHGLFLYVCAAAKVNLVMAAVWAGGSDVEAAAVPCAAFQRPAKRLQHKFHHATQSF